MSGRIGSCVVGSLLLLSGLATPAFAAPGDLDPSFGTRGKVTTEFSRGGNTAFAVVIQADGRIVVGGWAYGKGFALARYLPDGTLDPSFGGDGKVTTNFPAGPAVITDLALQRDGRVVAVGFAEGFVEMARYRIDGRLDDSFGRHGMVTARYKGAQTSAEGATLQPDGDIVVGAVGGSAYGMAVQPGGGILLAGSQYSDFTAARYRSGGALDTTFGDMGVVHTSFPNYGTGTAVALQPNGRFVIAGNSGLRVAVARYLA